MKGQTSGDQAQSGISPEDWGKQVFEHSAVGIAVAELDGRFLTANSAFQSMVGYTEAELRELTALDLAEEADRPATRDLLSQLGAGVVRQYQVEDRFRRKDGSPIWIRKTLSLIPAVARLVGYVVAIAEDITERKREEHALKLSLAQFRSLASRIESAREEERKRLARRIHDDLGQAWTGIKMDVSYLLHHPLLRRQERQ